MEYPSELIRLKTTFLIEQMELTFMQNMHRHYLPDLFPTCALWENTLCNVYKKIQEEGLLTIPSQRYIHKLTSALSVDTGLTDSTWKYLDARVTKLNERAKIGSLLIDEVYAAKR